MMVQFKVMCYVFVAVAALLVNGCAPSSANKSDVTPSSSSGASGAQGMGSQQQGDGQRGTTRESSVPSGSLDALRHGKPTATPSSSPLQDVLFDYDRYDLRPDARDTLRVNAEWLKSNPSTRIEIEGHCDERGTNEYNLALGAKRAQSAKDYLVTLGISAERLSTISYGEEIAVCKEPNENCWGRNRRARFVIIPSRPAS